MSFDDCDSSELVGQSLGPYQVVACVRRGQHTTVYRGRLRADTDKPVAIKVVNPDRLGQADILKRFAQEAETTRKFDHPRVVHVYACGEENYQPYLVMEWVKGKSLQEELKARGHLPPDDAATIAVHIAQALDYVHRQGWVHRDVKPSNLKPMPRSGRSWGICTHRRLYTGSCRAWGCPGNGSSRKRWQKSPGNVRRMRARIAQLLLAARPRLKL